MLMVTHDLPYACELCDRAVALGAGKLAADGPIDEILADEALIGAHRLELPLGSDLGLMRRLKQASGEIPGA
jgi:cobalt/nickel transport system ATP-binding protein